MPEPPATTVTRPFEDAEAFALELDAELAAGCLRERFHLPSDRDGRPCVYFCGNSLGLQPRAVRELIRQELDDWATLAVDAHFRGASPWYDYHETVREPLARLVGARPHEVVAMNSLTVNLHLLMVSFFRPSEARPRILIDWPTFPSDLYAVKSQLRLHGLDPRETLLVAQPRDGEHTLRTADLLDLIDREGDSIALVLLAGVNYFTGQLYDLEAVTAAARARGCVVGLDLAHAAGNVPLRLHDWGADFACWCSYKYLNAGPGAVAGAFVHDRHAERPDLPRLAGWWGNDPATRFRMHLEAEFVPVRGADGWQLSNPPILALAPLRAALALFDEAGMPTLRTRSLRLTGYLRWLLERHGGDRYEIITPREDEAHGAQLSLLVHREPRDAFAAIERSGVVCDYREPNVIRLAPAPLYNTFHDVWRCAEMLRRA